MPLALDLSLRAKHLFVAADWGSRGLALSGAARIPSAQDLKTAWLRELCFRCRLPCLLTGDYPADTVAALVSSMTSLYGATWRNSAVMTKRQSRPWARSLLPLLSRPPRSSSPSSRPTGHQRRPDSNRYWLRIAVTTFREASVTRCTKRHPGSRRDGACAQGSSLPVAAYLQKTWTVNFLARSASTSGSNLGEGESNLGEISLTSRKLTATEVEIAKFTF